MRIVHGTDEFKLVESGMACGMESEKIHRGWGGGEGTGDLYNKASKRDKKASQSSQCINFTLSDCMTLVALAVIVKHCLKNIIIYSVCLTI